MRQLSERMPEDHPIRFSALGEIERGERRVTVDDLTALAQSLGVSPIALLMPYTKRATEPLVTAAGVPETPPRRMLRWMMGVDDLDGGDARLSSLPPFAWDWEIADGT